MAQETPGGGPERNSAEVKAARERIGEAWAKVSLGVTINYDELFTDAAFLHETIGHQPNPKPKQGGWFGRKSSSESDGLNTDQFILSEMGKKDSIHDELWKLLDKAKDENNPGDIKKGLKALRAFGYDQVQGTDYDRFFDDLIKLDTEGLLEKDITGLNESEELRRYYREMGIADFKLRKNSKLSPEFTNRLFECDRLDQSEKVLAFVRLAARLGFIADPEYDKTIVKLRTYHTDLLAENKRQQEANEQAERDRQQAEADRQRQERERAERQQRAREQRQRQEQERQRKEQEEAAKQRAQGNTGTSGAGTPPGGQQEEYKWGEDLKRDERKRKTDAEEAKRKEEQRQKKEVIRQYINREWVVAERTASLRNSTDLGSSIQRYTEGMKILQKWILENPKRATPEMLIVAVETLISKIWLNMSQSQVAEYLNHPTTDISKENEVKSNLARTIFYPENHPNPQEAAKIISTKLKGVHTDRLEDKSERMKDIVTKMKSVLDEDRRILGL